MIAVMVVPFGRRNIASTASCFEEGAGAFSDAAFVAATFDEAVDLDRVALFLELRLSGRAGLRAAFADLDFDVLVAIWLSLV
jgi:hypothetical protein